MRAARGKNRILPSASRHPPVEPLRHARISLLFRSGRVRGVWRGIAPARGAWRWVWGAPYPCQESRRAMTQAARFPPRRRRHTVSRVTICSRITPPFIQTPAAEMSQGPGHHRLPPPFAGGSESYLPSPGKETARSSRGMMAKGHGSTTRAAGIPRSRENPATGAVRSLPARVWPSARFWTAANRNVTTKAQRYPIEFTGNSLYFCGVFFCLSAGTARTGARESHTAAPVAGFSRERGISWIVSGREFFGYPLTHSLASVRAAYGHDQAPCSRSRTPSPD